MHKTLAKLRLRFSYEELLGALREVEQLDELQMNILARFGVRTEKRRKGR